MDSARGKTILITGATSGIGREAARMLAAQGAHVVVGARRAESAAPLLAELRAAGHTPGLFEADMSSFASIRAGAASFLERYKTLDVLVNNAGVAMYRRETSVDGYEMTWAVNVLAPFLLTALLRPALDATANARVVTTGSIAYTLASRLSLDDPRLGKTFSALYSYADSKLAVVLFTRELARRAPHLVALAVHPGALATGIWRNLPGPASMLMQIIMRDAVDGARPLLAAATDPQFATQSGAYLNRFKVARLTYAGRAPGDAEKLWDIASAQTGIKDPQPTPPL